MRNRLFAIAAMAGTLIVPVAAQAQSDTVGSVRGGTVVIDDSAGISVDQRPAFREYIVREQVPTYTIPDRVIVGGVPATAYWIYCGDIDLFDAVILAELAAVGSVYALMALMASILHEDLRAANPITVFSAIFKLGWGYARPCLVCGAAVMAALTLFLGAYEASGAALSAFLMFVFWVVALYLAMVVLRVLGLYYHKNARVLGWFRDRSRWGV